MLQGNGTALANYTYVSEDFDWSSYDGAVEPRLKPTALRLDRDYIRIYILWMNLLIQIIGPFMGELSKHVLNRSHFVFKKLFHR